MVKPLVALVGRPNVGKSTLFNRLVGERVAIVEDVPGTTRDRLYGEFEWRGRDVSVVDTGGIFPGSEEDVSESVFEQAQLAIDEADVIVFLTDGRSGPTPVDEEITDLLRRANKPVILAVNKADNIRQDQQALEFHKLGIGDPLPLSAIRGLGTGDLLDRIVELLPPRESEQQNEEVARVAIVGRPNVGKSSLVNALLGKPRTIVSPIPGTTRDAVDTTIDFKGRPVVLVDTAGIRRRGKIVHGVERYSVFRALRAVDRADVAVLLVDANEPAAAQDAHVAGFVQERAIGLVVAVNKWDLIEKDSRTMAEYESNIRHQLKFLPYVPIVFISAKTGQRIENVLDLALEIREERKKRIGTGVLNEALRRALSEHHPPSSGGKLVKLFYMTQVAIDPPTFVGWVNDPSLVHFSFKRFLENQLRERFGFFGTPIRLFFRPRGREAVR
ncbi:MAG: ribosome biogenesis GTPase Der [Chloroflexota bacterium]|nr:MAG: ribosome biogenesis GTPase Der [Chloroflexota bacterium]